MTRDVPEQKFYFQHLSAAEQQLFVDQYNLGRMKMAAPGHFYVLPFFMRVVDRSEMN